MAVNVEWWSNYFGTQARSVGLTVEEAERVFISGTIDRVQERLDDLLAEIANRDPARRREILRLIEIKERELEKLQK